MDHPVCGDVKKLTKDFSKKNSFDFNDFKKEWMDKQFYFMHCVGKSPLRKTLLTEFMFCQATEIVLNEQLSLVERVGAIYMWYSLYMTQPQPSTIRIRLSLQDWYELEKLHETLRQECHHDVDYILCKLKSMSVYYVCAHRKKLCLGQKGEIINSQLLLMGEQKLVGPDSNVITNLTEAQKSLQNYASMKNSLADHLPPHLLSVSTSFDDLLSEERLQQLKASPANAQEREERRDDEGAEGEGEGEEGGEQWESRRMMVLQKAYRSDPKLIDKRK